MNLSSNELTQLRADQADYFPDTCTLQTVSLASDGMGGQTPTWSNTHTSVACRVYYEQGGSEEMQGGQPASESQWVLTVAHNQTLTEKMRCVHDSETYEIVRLADTHSNRTAKRAYMVRLD